MAETQQPGALLGGNITIPVLDIIDRLSPGSRVILELSSFQLGDLEHKQYSPRVAVLTNFMEDHLDYYRGMEEYFRDKSLIYRYQTRGDRLVVNRDDSVLDLVLSSGGRVTDTFGAGGPMNGFGTFLRDSTVWCRGQEGEYPLLPVGEFPLPGRHNLYNLLCAAAAARSAGIAPDAVRTAAAGFKGLGHRMEFLGSWRGIRIYNDSAATTPDAAAAAIESLEGPLTVIAGGADKNLPLGRFAAALKEKVHALVLLEGSGTTRLLQQEPGLDASCHDTIDSALGRALEMAAPGGAVVLSPGFASFGLFRNEFDRGDRFREAVRKLTEKEIP
jgi:UDP-N-acetylmuramoylalanine--D-glutamate ligase